MRKLTAIGERIIVKSRGVKEEMESGLIIPEKFLRSSNVCTTESGEVVIIRDYTHKDVGDGRWIVETKNILAEIRGNVIIPAKDIVHVRKCEDPDDGIIRTTTRNTQFAEVISCGPDGCGESGWFAYVTPDAVTLQKIEDGFDEWLIPESDILFYVVN